MAEKIPRHGGESRHNNDDWYPTESQLEAFEEQSEGVPFFPDEPLEKFTRDPQNPTDDEVKAWKEFNAGIPLAFDPLSFEEYFGRPDPRKPRPSDESDQVGEHDSRS